MWEEMRFEKDDVIAVIAPHPDDECLGASAALLMAPEKTDVYVLTDGSHGNEDRSIDEEAKVRRAQFDAEMAHVKPRNAFWLGFEDTTLPRHYEAADTIDFTKYTKVFLPWHKSLHPDHRAACEMCCKAIMKQRATPECFIYEVTAPFHQPSHYIDISGIIDEKRQLVDFHEDQSHQKEITIGLNAFRAAQLLEPETIRYVECYLKIDPWRVGYNSDILVKLYTFKEDFGLYDRLLEKGIKIKRALACDTPEVKKFVSDNFSGKWADEAVPAIMKGSCFIAVHGRDIIAFGCADATARAYIGPGGTLEEYGGLGLYRALIQRCYRYLIEHGYKYAIVGMASYKVRGVHKDLGDGEPIEGSRGAYDDLLIRE